MIKEVDFQTYLSISNNKFEIFLFDKKNTKNLYKDEFKIDNKLNLDDLSDLSKFLDNSIFKIEKLVGMFVENIFIILDHDKNLNVNICVKKKIYDNLINQKNLENTLTEIKDLFKENYPKQNIMHMVVNNYLINGKKHSSFTRDLNSDQLCLEVSFISIPNNLIDIFEKILKNYQIKISNYIDGKYLKDLFKGDSFELSLMADKVRNGYNENEVILIPKNTKNKGFFEKFFQLFG